MDSLYDDPDLYDLVSPRGAAMESFYVENAGGRGRKTLELACGTGRLTIPIAASGAEVVGADISRSMLSRARRAAEARGHAVHFVELDMRGFELGQTFDVVVIAANSLMHLHNHTEFAETFAAIRRHLSPGGVFCFDVFVPSPWLLSRPPGERQLLGVFAHPELGDVTVEETISYDSATQVSRADWYWSTAEHRDFRHTPLELRQIFPQELPLLLSLGGLKLSERYGDFDRGPFGSTSQRQVCIAVRA